MFPDTTTFLYHIAESAGNAIRIPFFIPTTARVAADALGWQIVLRALSQFPFLAVSPYFFDGTDGFVDIYGTPLPPSATDAYDTALLSLSYEVDVRTVVNLYPRYLAGKRVYAGGMPVTANPHLIAGITDALFMGEFDALCEDDVAEVARALYEGECPPFFIPSRVFVDEGREVRYETHTCTDAVGKAPASALLLPSSSFRAYLIEANRGCPFNCRFCEIPHVRACRYFTLDAIEEALADAPPDVGRVAIVGTALASHVRFSEIIELVRGKGYDVSFSSLRADVLREEHVALLADAGVHTITLAPEVGSDRLKRYVRKYITRDALLETMCRGIRYGVRRFRLYYIVGFPSETEADLAAIVDDVYAMLSYAKKDAATRKWMPEIHVSVNPFIIKRVTYEEGMRFLTEREWNAKVAYLKKALYAKGGVSVKFHNYHEARLEGLLSFADASVARELLENGLAASAPKRLSKTLASAYHTDKVY